jgi:outer membrane lipoprotein carrier protein
VNIKVRFAPHVLVIASLFPPTLYAQDEEAIAEITQAIGQLQSAKGHFEQIIREQDGYLLDRQTGEFALQRPRKLSWRIAELDQLLVSDGEQMYLYDELFEQVIVRDWSSDPTINPAAILLDDIQLEDWAAVEISGQGMKLTPLDGYSSILEIELVMTGQFPEILRLLDTTGQITEIRFSNLELDSELAPELFIFDIPSGTEVIYEN